MNDNNDIFLNDCWSIYFHDPYDIKPQMERSIEKLFDQESEQDNQSILKIFDCMSFKHNMISVNPTTPSNENSFDDST